MIHGLHPIPIAGQEGSRFDVACRCDVWHTIAKIPSPYIKKGNGEGRGGPWMSGWRIALVMGVGAAAFLGG